MYYGTFPPLAISKNIWSVSRIWLVFLLVLTLLVSVLPTSRFISITDYSLPRGVELHDGDEFDYVVVGAGAGGCAVAARLALAGADVLLVEAGGDPGLLSKIPGVAIALLGSNLDWQYQTVPNGKSCLSSQGRQCRFSRGKCVGGSTSINHMIYVRGNRRDFDDFGIPGWTWDDIQPYFLKYEGLQDLNRLPPSSIPFHNISGPIHTGVFEDSGNPWHTRLIKGFRSLKFPYNPDVNAKSQIGVSKVIGYVDKNERMSTARAYLGREDVKSTLRLAKNTMCTGVIIDDTNTARGVTVVQGKRNKTISVYARREVILSAGTVGSPKLLMLSGVGPAEHLRRMGIPVRVNLSVGDDMMDHILPIIPVLVDPRRTAADDLIHVATLATQTLQALISGNGPLTSIGLTSVTAFANTHCYDSARRRLLNDRPDCEVPSMQVIHGFFERNLIPLTRNIIQRVLGLNDYIVDQFRVVNAQHALLILSPVVLEPHSRGHVRLSSADPLAVPTVFPNYLDDDHDVDEMLRSIAIMEDLVKTPAFAQQNATLFRVSLPECPPYELNSDAYWRCYVRYMTYSGYHAVGTCALGRVVDEKLRVVGVRRLRVGDASVLPRPPRGNSEAAVVAVAERLAEFILEDDL